MKTRRRRPVVTAAIAVLSTVGALVQFLPAPHEASPIEPAQILPLDAQAALFPQR